MSTLPAPIEELLDAALVGELTVVDATGHPVTYPLIPLYDGERIYLTSSTLFSRKLEHIKGNPKVSLSITDPIAVGGRADRVDDPGRRPGDRGGPARRLGAPPPDLGEEGAVDRVLPEGPRRAAAVLRAVADRDHPAPRPLLGRRRSPRRRRSSATPGRRPRDGTTDRRRPADARPSTPRQGLDQARELSRSRSSPSSTPTATRSASPSTAAIDPAAGTATFAAPAGLTVPERRRRDA